MYYVDEWSGFENGTKRWFEAILKTFPGEKVLSRQCSQDLWNPIMNKDVPEMDHVDRDSGETRHSWTEKLLMA